MLHVGVDQHKKFSQIILLDEKGGKVAARKLYHDDKDSIRKFFRSLSGDMVATLEATGSWYWLYDLLEEECSEVKLANPARVRLIADARIKTDKIDAEVLAHLERTGYLPQSYVPPGEVRAMRERHRHRLRLVKMQTALKNQVHALLSKLGIEHRMTDLFGKAGRQFLKSLELGEPYAGELGQSLRILDCLAGEIEKARRTIAKELASDPGAELLQSIPGIGGLSAYLILAEVGNIGRFPSAKKFASYCALAPSTRQSAETIYHGHVGRHGNRYLKWTLVEAAHKAVSKDPALGALAAKLRRKKGGGKAIVAVARKLSVAVYHILKRKVPYKYNSLSKIHLGKPVPCSGRKKQAV